MLLEGVTGLGGGSSSTTCGSASTSAEDLAARAKAASAAPLPPSAAESDIDNPAYRQVLVCGLLFLCGWVGVLWCAGCCCHFTVVKSPPPRLQTVGSLTGTSVPAGSIQGERYCLSMN